MSQEYAIEPGVLAEDCEDADSDPMLVLEISDAPCDDEDEAFVKWDYNMNPVTVADENEDLGYDPDQPFVVVAFVPALDRRAPGWDSRDFEYACDRLDAKNVKTYKYPLARLQATGRQFEQ